MGARLIVLVVDSTVGRMLPKEGLNLEIERTKLARLRGATPSRERRLKQHCSFQHAYVDTSDDRDRSMLS